ncbi:unnamed protein product, partial [Didymodactylos carnosus]
ITDIHCSNTGAPRFFVNVVLIPFEKGNGYVGGDPNNTPCLVQGLIRSGRTQEVKTKMLHELSALVAKITELDEKCVTVGFLEGSAKNALENGMEVPEAGEEIQWMEKYGIKVDKQ